MWPINNIFWVVESPIFSYRDLLPIFIDFEPKSKEFSYDSYPLDDWTFISFDTDSPSTTAFIWIVYIPSKRFCGIFSLTIKEPSDSLFKPTVVMSLSSKATA